MDLKKLDAAEQRLGVLERRVDALRDRSNATTSALIHWGRKGAGSDPACGRNAAMTYARDKYESFPEDTRCQLCQRAYEKLRDKTGGTFSFKKVDADVGYSVTPGEGPDEGQWVVRGPVSVTKFKSKAQADKFAERMEAALRQQRMKATFVAGRSAG